MCSLSKDNCLLPLAPQRANIRKLIAADIETLGLGGIFVQGATLTESGLYTLYDDPQLLVSDFLTSQYRSHEMLFHNADYDLRYLLPSLLQYTTDGYDTNIIVNGQARIIFVRVKRGKDSWYIRDTFALMPTALKNLAPLANMQKLDIGLSREVDFDPNNPAHQVYLRRDVTMLLEAYKTYRNTIIDTWQVVPSITVGSTAIKIFRRALYETPSKYYCYYRQRDSVETLARSAYYGGLVFTRTLKRQYDVTCIDCNAMYAAAMQQGVPLGPACETTKERPGKYGIYNCHVYCPDSVTFSFLPQRFEGQLRWPKGYFDTTLCSNTITYARSVGYQIDVINGYDFAEIGYIFKPFLEQAQKLEIAYKHAGTGLYEVVKFMRNSLSGKFGQKEQTKNWHLSGNPRGNWTPYVDNEGDIVHNLYWSVESRRAAHMMVHWIAWITSSARNILARMVYAIGAQHCYYGDTDSLYVSTPALMSAIEQGKLDIGEHYGEWKIEGRYDYLQVHSLKLKVARNEATNRYYATHKGAPSRAVDGKQLANMQDNIVIPYTQISKAIATINDNNYPRAISKTLSKLVSDNRWTVHKNGDVTPVFAH